LPPLPRGPIAALFVSRDALNFGVVQTLLAIIMIVAFAIAAAAWSLRRKSLAADITRK
jgi:hypothetical protein